MSGERGFGDDFAAELNGPVKGRALVAELEALPTVVTAAGRGLALAVLPPMSGARWADSEMSKVVFFSCHSITTFLTPIETNL